MTKLITALSGLKHAQWLRQTQLCARASFEGEQAGQSTGRMTHQEQRLAGFLLLTLTLFQRADMTGCLAEPQCASLQNYMFGMAMHAPDAMHALHLEPRLHRSYAEAQHKSSYKHNG